MSEEARMSTSEMEGDRGVAQEGRADGGGGAVDGVMVLFAGIQASFQEEVDIREVG